MASVDETIEIIRETPISSVISFYHPLKKKGANYEGICPFHGDRHPSMVVSDQKGIFKCFACGAGGDAFKFVMDYANLEFLEAVKEVADKLGIQVEEAKKRQANPKADMALRIVKAAGKLYEKVGREVAPEHFKDFLTQRKLSEESVTNFSIGYAPANNSLTSYLSSIPDEKERSFALATAQEIGIIRKDQRGRGHYDFFRERVMFPVWDHSGVLRGFCGRTVLANQKAKYMNSVDSLIFDKGTILFGYNFAKKSVRQHEAVLIVEGHMDVIALHQYGFNYAVGTQGTAMSEANARMLAGAAKNIYLGMDSDPAGIKAM
ncbi:MAG: DNA primase, partial [Bacteriovoracaceae bacterium]